MKRFIYIIAILLVGFTSCKKDKVTPPIPIMNEGKELTVGAILDSMYKETSFLFTDTCHINALVIGDERSGNIYRTVYVRDDKGKCIAVYRPSGSEDFQVRTGDYITLQLKGSIAGFYNGLPQIQIQEQDPNTLIIIRQRNRAVEATSTTLEEVESGARLCDLITLDEVQFAEYEGLKFANPTSSGDRAIEDASGYSAIVRTSNYATFANEYLPKGNGKLTCVVSLYQQGQKKTWQLLVRDLRDVNMYGPRHDDEDIKFHELPYNQSFASKFGTYSTFDYLGAQTWLIDFSTAKMTGYENNTNYANEDWLVSTPTIIENVAHAKVSMTYIARYFSNLKSDITINVSRDYRKGKDPKTCQWTTLTADLIGGSDWNTFYTTEISLDEYLNDTVTIAVKYLSTDAKAGTIEIQKISIVEGEPEVPGGGGELQELPYNTSFATSFGTYTTYSAVGDEVWEIDYSSAKMSGHPAGSSAGTNHKNLDFLLSSPVNLTKDAQATINYASNYFNGTINTYLKVIVAEDYVFGENPEDYTWDELDVKFEELDKWTFSDLVIDLSQYTGKQITFGVRYESTTSLAGTIEIKSINIK